MPGLSLGGDGSQRAHDERSLVDLALHLAPTLVVLLDGAGRLMRFNRACERLSGYGAEEVLGRVLWDFLIPAGEVDEVRRAFGGLLDGSAQSPLTLRHDWRRRDGSEVALEWAAERVICDEGRPACLIAIGTDLTARHALEQQLRELALRDDLTGLLNRRGFVTLAEQLLRVAVRKRRGAGLVFVDADNMKRINDREGHAVGDEALRETAQVLREVVREADVVGRIGGDEFAVLLVDAGRPVLDDVLARIDATVRRRNGEVKAGRLVRAGRYRLSVSAGGALFDPEVQSPLELQARPPVTLHQLIDEADRAMYARKAGH